MHNHSKSLNNITRKHLLSRELQCHIKQNHKRIMRNNLKSYEIIQKLYGIMRDHELNIRNPMQSNEIIKTII